MSDRRVIYTFEKNSVEQVQISLTEFKGQDFVDIRAFYRSESGDFKPTRKGLTISVELLPNLLEGLEMVRRETLEEVEA